MRSFRVALPLAGGFIPLTLGTLACGTAKRTPGDRLRLVVGE